VGTPEGPSDTAWFNIGPRPGDNGSAVIAGHYGPWKTGQGSVFDNLNNLKIGDKIYIEGEKGTTATFVVRELRTYSQNEYAPEVFNSSDGKAHLNLITCEGTWSDAQKTYSNRLVVFTDKE
jgi:LPXTG-site transpeptidase (sortase) family protein